MLTLRKANDRGHVNHGRLNSYHTFSFSNDYALNHMDISNLRVINEDAVSPNGGFAEHGHEDI